MGRPSIWELRPHCFVTRRWRCDLSRGVAPDTKFSTYSLAHFVQIFANFDEYRCSWRSVSQVTQRIANMTQPLAERPFACRASLRLAGNGTGEWLFYAGSGCDAGDRCLSARLCVRMRDLIGLHNLSVATNQLDTVSHCRADTSRVAHHLVPRLCPPLSAGSAGVACGGHMACGGDPWDVVAT